MILVSLTMFVGGETGDDMYVLIEVFVYIYESNTAANVAKMATKMAADNASLATLRVLPIILVYITDQINPISCHYQAT
jgi:hypothetical protein